MSPPGLEETQEKGALRVLPQNLTITIPETQLRGHLPQEAFLSALCWWSWAPLDPTTGQGPLC